MEQVHKDKCERCREANPSDATDRVNISLVYSCFCIASILSTVDIGIFVYIMFSNIIPFLVLMSFVFCLGAFAIWTFIVKYLYDLYRDALNNSHEMRNLFVEEEIMHNQTRIKLENALSEVERVRQGES
jgi:ABC-type bacteriocin/lantibiotic exporter with double-glycine peptidase domain